GIDSRRKLPRFHKPLYKRVRVNREVPNPQKKVIYFSGCFANFNDPVGEGLSTIEILRRNNVDVRVLDSLRCCGIAKITTGNRDAVAEDATWNVAELAKYVKEGCDIMASAPSCGLAIKEDYPGIDG
ncbi:MAG TPA: heterodisulfide reductase-related iron-sulfur binding cluster, partial [Candidatus Kryptobacter bacterium]|nr:heterodisulfide reductase-related iron-sulfur binding cluster [Candidatus Kryptobacter bacterium]